MIRICPLLKNSNLEEFEKVLNTGFNTVRFNFSHINIDIANQHKDFIRKKYPDVKIMQDLQGHKIRVGNIKDIISINKNTQFLFVPEGYESELDFPQVPLLFENYDLLYNTSKFMVENKNSTAIISILKRITECGKTIFLCISNENIVFRKEKGVNAIGFDRLRLKLSEKDKRDVLWGLENKADIIVYSFASSAEQILELKEYIKSKSSYMPQIWAKIESREGVTNIEEIINVCDGIMIGRGDMCVEFSMKNIPHIQNNIIKACKNKNTDCIVATYIFDNYKNKNKPDISDITSLYYFCLMGATGFMPVNEIIFANNPYKISKNINNLLNHFEEEL